VVKLEINKVNRRRIMHQRINGINVWGEPLLNAVEQMVAVSEDAVCTALMSDHHLGYHVPIGGVVAYNGHISPAGVGYDIGCGNQGSMLSTQLPGIAGNLDWFMDEIFSKISFGVGQKNNKTVEHELFDRSIWTEIPLLGELKDLARKQLGTVGSGNHYVDLLRDEETDQIWISVHFGSRGLGHKIATHYMKLADKNNHLLDVSTEVGQEYIAAMQLAGDYAAAGRDWVSQTVAGIIGGDIIYTVQNHHNFTWKEKHFGGDYWIVRKGATPLFPGQESIIGGTMTDATYIIRGVDSDEAKLTMYSAPHGAGRLISRTAATGRSKYGKKKHGPGLVTQEMMDERIVTAGVVLRGAGRDESPHCYKNIDEVIKHHEGTFEYVYRLIPIGVAMAGKEVHDPFVD